MSDNRPSHMLTDAELKARVDAFTILTEHNAICTCGVANPKPIVKRGSYVRWFVSEQGHRHLADARSTRRVRTSEERETCVYAGCSSLARFVVGPYLVCKGHRKAAS